MALWPVRETRVMQVRLPSVLKPSPALPPRRLPVGGIALLVAVTVLLSGADGWLAADGVGDACHSFMAVLSPSHRLLLMQVAAQLGPPHWPMSGWMVSLWTLLVVAAQELTSWLCRRAGVPVRQRRLLFVMTIIAALIGAVLRCGA